MHKLYFSQVTWSLACTVASGPDELTFSGWSEPLIFESGILHWRGWPWPTKSQTERERGKERRRQGRKKESPGIQGQAWCQEPEVRLLSSRLSTETPPHGLGPLAPLWSLWEPLTTDKRPSGATGQYEGARGPEWREKPLWRIHTPLLLQPNLAGCRLDVFRWAREQQWPSPLPQNNVCVGL